MAKYTNFNVPKDTIVWACAYSTNSTEKSMALKKLPVRGMVKSKVDKWSLEYFYEVNKKDEIIKSKRVHSESRSYADTQEECREIYESLVEKQICLLEKLIDDCRRDLLV